MRESRITACHPKVFQNLHASKIAPGHEKSLSPDFFCFQILHQIGKRHPAGGHDAGVAPAGLAPRRGQIQALNGRAVVDAVHVGVVHRLRKSVNRPFGIARKAPVGQRRGGLPHVDHCGKTGENRLFHAPDEDVRPAVFFFEIGVLAAGAVVGFKAPPGQTNGDVLKLLSFYLNISIYLINILRSSAKSEKDLLSFGVLIHVKNDF